MFHKIAIMALAICALVGCTESRPLPAGLGIGYECQYQANPNKGISINGIKQLKDLENPPYTKSLIRKSYSGLHWKHYKLHSANIIYYMRPTDVDTYNSHKSFEYKNIDFEYINDSLVIKIPEDEDMPACEIKFDKNGVLGEHKCTFESNDKAHRAKTFKIECQHSPSKYRYYGVDEL